MTSNASFQLLMISAMYENGGNTTQRLLDGHPELFSYPFESQLGTRFVNDRFTSLFPNKYRWPVFPLDDTCDRDYETIIDEECKARIKTPQSSKFRDVAIDLDDVRRKAAFLRAMDSGPRTRARLVEAFFRATAEAWLDACRSGRERVYVGYSPIVAVDAEPILTDLPSAHVLHVVRNPWSAYADTKKRAVPLSMDHYLSGWCVTQLQALAARERFPDRVHMIRYEDLIIDPVTALAGPLAAIGVGASPAIARPSWNGRNLDSVHPWGTIRTPTAEANRKTAMELSAEEAAEVRRRTRWLLGAFDYEGWL